MITIKQKILGKIKFYVVKQCEYIEYNSDKWHEVVDILMILEKKDIFPHPTDYLEYKPELLINSECTASSIKDKVICTIRENARKPLGALKTPIEIDKESYAYQFFYEGDSLSIITNGVMIDLIE